MLSLVQTTTMNRRKAKGEIFEKRRQQKQEIHRQRVEEQHKKRKQKEEEEHKRRCTTAVKTLLLKREYRAILGLYRPTDICDDGTLFETFASYSTGEVVTPAVVDVFHFLLSAGCDINA